MKELPKTFYNAKREFEKSFNFAISKAKNENKDKEPIKDQEPNLKTMLFCLC